MNVFCLLRSTRNRALTQINPALTVMMSLGTMSLGTMFIGSMMFGLLLAESTGQVFAADQSQTLNGHLEWSEVTRLSSPVSGVVTQIPVQPGQQVAKGAVLLQLDHKPFSDRLAAATAMKSGWVRAAAEAKRDAQRVQQLYDRTVASESERQDALIKQEQAEAKLNEARAKVGLRRWELARTTLTAPYPARVLSVRTAVGETVSSELQAPELMRIARADAMLAEANLSPDRAAQLSLGQKLNVLVGQDRVQGKLVGIVSEQQKSPDGVVTYRIMVQIHPQKNWVAGLPAKIELPE